jgi:hypothetical protein
MHSYTQATKAPRSKFAMQKGSLQHNNPRAGLLLLVAVQVGTMAYFYVWLRVLLAAMLVSYIRLRLFV